MTEQRGSTPHTTLGEYVGAAAKTAILGAVVAGVSKGCEESVPLDKVEVQNITTLQDEMQK